MTMKHIVTHYPKKSKLNFLLQGDIFFACKEFGFYYRRNGKDVIIYSERFADEVDQVYLTNIDREVYKLQGPYTSILHNSLIILYRDGTEKKVNCKIDRHGFVDFFEEENRSVWA